MYWKIMFDRCHCIKAKKYLLKGQDSRRVKIDTVSKIDEILLYCMCMSSVTENDLF